MEEETSIDQLSVNTIRALTIDAVQKANSGHPGAPMGLAPVGYTLWDRFLRHNPGNPDWPGRDRFVLSAGHASMLLYSLLYLTGYDVSIEDLMDFRQLGSVTPGHPEFGVTPGVEVTAGPLGQGISNGIGMALARELVGARFNRPGHDLTDYYVYVICSDGDLMEGVASEACSIAGHLGLGRLVCLYDDNNITIEGCTDLSFSEDVAARFRAYGWNVLSVPDANDVEAVAEGIEEARLEMERPSLVIITSRIACGSPNLEGCEDAHGAPLGVEEVRLTKQNLGWPDEQFFVPREVLEHTRLAVKLGQLEEERWRERFAAYEKEYPELASDWRRVMDGRLPEGWEESLPVFDAGKKIATREASGKVLEALTSVLPELIGGSADLGPSNKTCISGAESIRRGDFSGRNIHFGVREHGMGSLMNGMARHGGVIPYGGTFLVFADYMRPAVRIAALMGVHVVYVFTHDSLGVGEDGPTHQPVEQIAALRAIPDLVVLRPADANETSAAWKVALERGGPVALVLSRQGLPVMESGTRVTEGVSRGAYVLADTEGEPDVILIATGSEVALALEAAGRLAGKGTMARVVSMPSWELFEEQEAAYRESVLPAMPSARLALEAGVTMGWCRYTGIDGAVLGVDEFGVSAPGAIALSEAGFTVENVVRKVKELLEG